MKLNIKCNFQCGVIVHSQSLRPQWSSLALILGLGLTNLFAQIPSVPQFLEDRKVEDFFDLQGAMNLYYKTYPGEKGEKLWRRKEWFLEPRLYPEGKMENLAMKTFVEQEAYFREKPAARSTHGGWLFLGPSQWQAAPDPADNSGLGRISCIEIHPTDNQIIYAGTASGGVWRSINGGSSWVNITPHLPLISVADIIVDIFNPETLYLLTGDGDPVIEGPTSHTQSYANSYGILKSTDQGSTWSKTGLSFLESSGIKPFKLVQHPLNEGWQYAATDNGLYITQNSWASYTLVFSQPVFDIEFKPNDPAYIYIALRNEVWRSHQNGQLYSWYKLNDPDFAFFTSAQRIELGVSPDNGHGVYAFISANSYMGLMYSPSNGIDNTWQIQDTTDGIFFGPYGIYCSVFAVDPEDHEIVYGANIGLARSTSKGVSGSWTAQFPGHPDVHDFAIRDGILYCAHDGGLWKSANNGTTWTEISQGISCTEVYTVTGTPLNTNVYIIGAQDVGHLKRTSTSSTFTTIGCCDGMISIIHPTDINTIYIAGQGGGINKSTTGLPPFDGTGNPGNSGAWNTPYIMDPVNHEMLWVARDTIHRTDDGGETWDYFGAINGSNFNNMIQGVNNRNKMYVSIGSAMWRTEQALSPNLPVSWTSIDNELPDRFITGIAVNPDDAAEVYVTFSGYGNQEKVFMSNSSGIPGTWVNISGTLPNIPINCIEYYDDGTTNDALYIGTDIGVFYRDNALGDWIYYSNYLPSASISDLYINYANSTIAAAVYGRGLWLSNLYNGCDANVTLSGTTSHAGLRYFSASNQITSTAVNRFDHGTTVFYTAGNYIDFKDGFRAGGNAYFEGMIGPCPTNWEVPLNSPHVPHGKLLLSNDELEAILRGN